MSFELSSLGKDSKKNLGIIYGYIILNMELYTPLPQSNQKCERYCRFSDSDKCLFLRVSTSHLIKKKCAVIFSEHPKGCLIQPWETAIVKRTV